MTNPITIHTINRAHVSRGSPYIKYRQKRTPKGETTHTSGVRNGRLIKGSVKRKTRTPAQTIANANNVPIETNSPSNPIGNNPATSVAIDPVKIVASHGVWNRECTTLKIGGSKPSLDIV